MNSTQPTLFPEEQTNSIEPKQRYQIKRFDDSEFKINIEGDLDDIENIALKELGYFIVPEIFY